MKVVFLGAGASRGADYPAAANLLDSIKDFCEATTSTRSRRCWEDYRAYVEGTQEEALRRLFDHPNPEIALSAVDLLQEARSEEKSAALKCLQQNEKKPEGADPDVVRRFGPLLSDAPRGLREAMLAAFNLLTCLDDFFWSKLCELGTLAFQGPSAYLGRLEYLDREFQHLEAGDIVITTNWDSLAEMVLLGRQMWQLTDGYGLRVAVEPAPRFAEPSAVKVLKLHGSFGWYTDGASKFFISHARFLGQIPGPPQRRVGRGGSS